MLITGALLGAGGDIVGQMISNQSMDLSKIDWGSVALSGLAGGATGLFSATGAGPVAMGIMGGVTSGSTEIYHQMQSGEEINWGQVATRTIGGVVSGSVLGGVGSQTASGAKEIAKNAGKVFLANGTASLVENTAYNLQGGDDLVSSVKNASVSALISGTTSSGFYALGQVGRNMCFVEGTMVLTAAGLVVIESIAVGDMVIATDPETGETAEKEVKNTFVNETEELAHVFVDGEEIVCTPGHKFYAPEKGWTSAIKLRAGDKLQLVNGEYVTVEKVQHELLEEPVKVYNFEVEDFHTYYVGADVQVLVHNMFCGSEENINKNGQTIRQDDQGNWHDVTTGQFAEGPNGSSPKKIGTGIPQPEQLVRGNDTEKNVLKHLGLEKNTEALPNGHIPDAYRADKSIVEIKDRKNVYYTDQLKEFTDTTKTDLYVTPDAHVSKNAVQGVEDSGGKVYVIDPKTGKIKEY